MDQPRDIHGTPIYAGDRVAIATARGEGAPELIVRVVSQIKGSLIWVPEIDGFDGVYWVTDAKFAFLRLP